MNWSLNLNFLTFPVSFVFRNEAKKRADLAEAAEAMEATATKRASPPKAARGTPYRGTSRWSRLLKVSTLQRSIQIWSFALFFAIRYFLSTRKFTYGKKVLDPIPFIEQDCRLCSGFQQNYPLQLYLKKYAVLLRCR